MAEISIQPASGREGSAGVIYTVRLSETVDQDVTLTLLIRTDTTVVGEADFDRFSGVDSDLVVTIPAGTLSVDVPIYHNGGAGDEIDEASILEALNPKGATFSGGAETLRVTGVIEDNGLALLVSDPVLVEANAGRKDALFFVELSRESSDTVILNYETRDGTALEGEDYLGSTGEITFDPGETVATVRVPVIGDRLPEVSETFSLYVTPAAGSSGEVQQPDRDAIGTALILDDDSVTNLPVLTVEPVAGFESSVGHPLMFRLSEASRSDVSFTVRLIPQTAEPSEADVDFDRFSGIQTSQDIVIPAGDTAFYTYVYHNGSFSDETDENYAIELVNLEGAAFAGDEDFLSAPGVILDDGRAVFVSDPFIFEGDDTNDLVTFEVRLSRPSDQPMVFDYNTLNRTAEAGDDFIDKAGRLRFDPGETVKYVDVRIKADRDAEPDEQFGLRVEPIPSTAAQLADATGDNVGVATIRNDDRSLELIRGNKRDNDLAGEAADERIEGRGGADTLSGGGGNDVLLGGPGRDLLIGGPGADFIDGGPGFDLVSYADSGSRVVVSLRDGRFQSGTAEGDEVVNVEGVVGTDFNDLIRGSNGADQIDGGAGNDRLFGRSGADTMTGGQGNDLMRGGDGSDILIGGAGKDRLFGEGGADTFVIEPGGNRDRIQDFDPDEDRLVLDPGVLGGLTDIEAILDEYARDQGDDILLALRGGSSVILRGIEEAGDLAGAIAFELG